MKNQEAYQRAKQRVEAKVGFYRHLTVYIAVNALLIVINLSNSHQLFNMLVTIEMKLDHLSICIMTKMGHHGNLSHVVLILRNQMVTILTKRKK